MGKKKNRLQLDLLLQPEWQAAVKAAADWGAPKGIAN